MAMVSNANLLDLYAALRRAVSVEANDVLRRLGLGSRQFIILWSLNRNKSMTIGELVLASMTDKACVSRSLAQLIEYGLVEKVQSEKDGRVWHVRLSAKGQKMAPELESLYRELAQRCFQILKPQERSQLAELLSRVISGFERSTPVLAEV